MKKILIGMLSSLLISVLLWFVFIAHCPVDFIIIMAVSAILSTATFICLSIVCIARLVSSKLSAHAVFAIADIILAIGVALYGIYDMNTDTSLFPGLFGFVLLILVVPTLVFLLIVDLIIWLIGWVRQKNKQ